MRNGLRRNIILLLVSSPWFCCRPQCNPRGNKCFVLFGHREIVRLNALEIILRGPLSFGQDETKSKLIRGRISSRRLYMHSRPSMHSCLCECFYCKLLQEANMNRLMFMTYNGWVMLAMFIGSFLGYLSFGGGTPAMKETACH